MFPILNPSPTSLPVPSLWVIPVHQPYASCILHWTWTGDSFLIWYCTCFNAILPNHPPFPLPQSPKDCSIHLCLFGCLTYSVIVQIPQRSACMYNVWVHLQKLSFLPGSWALKFWMSQNFWDAVKNTFPVLYNYSCSQWINDFAISYIGKIKSAISYIGKIENQKSRVFIK